MQSNISRRAVLAGVPAVVATAALPAIPVLAAVEQDPIVALGHQWQTARERWRHWSDVEDQTQARSGWGSPEHKEAKRAFDKVHNEMLELEGAMSRGQATTVAGLLARWEVIEWLGDYLDHGEPDPKAVAMRADLERLSGGAS